MRVGTETDVIAVGTGAAGLSAALAASVSGARVMVVEKAPVIGGTTAMSGGCIWVPGHHHMAEWGLRDTREAALEYIRAVSPDGWHWPAPDQWSSFCERVRTVSG
jgi:3-oxosteroid 1-dehydrogenase